MPTNFDAQDISPLVHRPISAYAPDGAPIDLTDEKVRLVIETVENSPPAWTPRLIAEEIWESGRRDVTEQLVANVMAAMR